MADDSSSSSQATQYSQNSHVWILVTSKRGDFIVIVRYIQEKLLETNTVKLYFRMAEMPVSTYENSYELLRPGKETRVRKCGLLVSKLLEITIGVMASCGFYGVSHT